MAGIAYVKKRVYNPELIVDPDGVLPMKLRQSVIKGYNPIYYINWLGATQAGEELGTAKTATKDGTATAYLVNVVCADALDDYDNAAGAVRAVAIIGLSVSSTTAYSSGAEVPLVTVEVLRTNGVADVNSTRYYLWLDHAYAVLWGSGGTDAEGAIDLEAPTGTVQIAIAITQNEGEGGQWHFPPNRRLFTHSVRLESTDAVGAGNGVVLTGTHTGFDQILNTDPDLDVDTYAMVQGGGDYREYHPIKPLGRYTTVNSSCIWSEALVTATEPINIEIIQYLDRGEG
ncbi:MAG: hypothetical protein KAJ19_26465 [Gammaproteobacteria bacterium]|nr:hypothetical protein [Gammaproteobacteria bacterium]